MEDQFCLIVCENLKNEVETVVQAENLGDAKIITYPSQCGLPGPNPSVIANAKRRCKCQDQSIFLVGGGCILGLDKSDEDQDYMNILQADPCLSMLIGEASIENYILQGAYLLTPGWLTQWRRHLQNWGFDRKIARSFFGENISQLILLDTGIAANAIEHLQEFGDYVNLPFEQVPVDLEYLQLRFARFFLERALRKEQKSSRESLEEVLKQSSDYAMAFDLIGRLTGMMSEVQVIEKIFELFTSLFAPRGMVYLPKINGRFEQHISQPADLSLSSDSRLRLISQKQDHAWAPDGKSFNLKLCHSGSTLGIIKVDDIAFPQYKSRYLNITLAVRKVCALAIANARTYQKLEKTVANLQSALLEREAAEKALKISERNLNSIIKTIPDIVYRLNPRGTIAFISDGVRKYGYSPQQLIGTDISQLVHPNDRKKAFYRINERRTGERSTRNLEIRLSPFEFERHSANDPKRSAESAPVFLISAEGLYASELPATESFMGTQGIARDISSQKRIEGEKKALENQIHRAQKMESIGTLAGGIAHDFNNLLMGIQGHVSLMSFDTSPEQPHYASLNSIEEFVESAANLTKQLLAFARGGKYEIKATDLNKLIRNTSQMFGRTRKEIEFRLALQPDLWTVSADHGQIEQVLFNLFLNAWQAMPEGGRINITTANRIISDRSANQFVTKAGEYSMLTVSDTGVGMDPATQARIFEPFYTTRQREFGTGLGLSSAYGIIKNHGGFIDVHSQIGRGSTFTIVLPAAKEETPIEEKSESKLLKGTETVLIVDDEKLIVDIGVQFLVKLGYRVLTANSGKEAIEIYRRMRDEIELIVLDMVMPQMSGNETYDHLKRINPNVKVILSTGYSNEGRTREILQKGCNGFIQKPFKIIEFSQKLRAVLDGKH